MIKTRQVFISHATEDSQFAHRLADDLQRLGVQVWIAPESIRAGEGWVSAIERGLEESSHVVVVLTPAALESKWVKKETDVAIAQERKGRIQVIPLNVEPCEVPLLLGSYQMVSFRRDYSTGLSQLANILDLRVTVHPTLMEGVLPFEPEMMILIPAGEFLMGSDLNVDKYARDDEQPQHALYLSDYYLAKTPLTNAQYAAFVEATDHREPEHWKDRKPPKGKEDHPVVHVSWHDAIAYCHWLSEITGKSYGLPSEAEWEKVARGTDGRIYPWGNHWDAKRCNAHEGDRGDTMPVEAYPEGVSPYGLLDMASNVLEWTHSLYKEYPYRADDGRENPDAWGDRVVRGGSWADSRDYARCSSRYWYLPTISRNDLGFRLAFSVGSEF